MAGENHFGIMKNNNLYTWGLNASGQLGDGTTINKSSPTVVTGLSPVLVTSTAMNRNSTIALVTDYSGTTKYLYSWGLNSNGQLGDNSIVNKSSPVLVGVAVANTVYSGGDSNYRI
jgi:hypothetical protein